ncbi:hypothetical protein DFS33DRAFT_1383153 [Desarmillaria ectypa]|nr:hypothetical protein DFS33DRAFT_1383153 [Desarmillaria ectypa]
MSSAESLNVLVQSWDAVLLIDEADVSDCLGALVVPTNHLGTDKPFSSLREMPWFLWLYEYLSITGVLFLTTNRIETFDEAFLSRFSIAIKYSELDVAGRQAIWQKFFSLAVSTKDLEGLVAKPFNGKSYHKNTVRIRLASSAYPELMFIYVSVRTAQALALSSDEPLGVEHVQVVLKAQEKLLDEF